MKRLLLASVLLTGCEMLVPGSGKKPNPRPDAPPVPEQKQRLEIVFKFDNEGKIHLAGDGTINLRANASATTQCLCGCGKDGCNCETRDIPGNASTPVKSGGNADAAASDRSAGDVFYKPQVFVYAPDWCNADACKAVKAAFLRNGKPRTDLPFEVVLKGAEDGITTFPTIKWSRVSDGMQFWFTGSTWGSLENVKAEWAKHK